VYSTAHDLALWLRATVNPTESQSVLTPETLAQMFTAQPASQGGGEAGFGLGYSLDTTLGSGTLIAHHDGVNEPGWRTYLAVIPDRGAGIALVTNSPGGAPLNHQASCAWTTYITQEVTRACLTESALGIGPVVVGVIILGAVTLLGLRRLRQKAD
jgi:CubicO group peptidase (beta-lactamase class C family)